MKKDAILLIFYITLVTFILIYPIKVVENNEKTTQDIMMVEEGELPSSEPIEEITEVVEVIEEPVKTYDNYRLTSFWANDSYGTGSCTGTGLCADDFQVNSKGWFTYKGHLVLAGATKACLNSKSGACGKWNTPKEGRHYFSYYDIIEVVIDDVTYSGIILDSCGACMYINNEERLDLFVSNEASAIDRGYKGRNTISVFKEE